MTDNKFYFINNKVATSYNIAIKQYNSMWLYVNDKCILFKVTKVDPR